MDHFWFLAVPLTSELRPQEPNGCPLLSTERPVRCEPDHQGLGLHGFRARRGHRWVPTASAKPPALPAPGRPRGCPLSGSTRILPATAPGRGGHGLAGLPGTQWGLGKFRRSEPLLAALHALPPPWVGPAPQEGQPGDAPEGWAPLPARGSVRAACPSPCAFLSGACAVGTGCAGRAVLPLRRLFPSTRGPPPHQPGCLAVWPQGFPAPPPCTRVPGAVLGHSLRPSGVRWLPVPRATW